MSLDDPEPEVMVASGGGVVWCVSECARAASVCKRPAAADDDCCEQLSLCKQVRDVAADDCASVCVCCCRFFKLDLASSI